MKKNLRRLAFMTRILKECRGARERAKFISNEIELYFEKLKIVSTNVKDL